MSAFSYKHVIGVLYLFVASTMATSVFADDMGGVADPQPIVLADQGRNGRMSAARDDHESATV